MSIKAVVTLLVIATVLAPSACCQADAGVTVHDGDGSQFFFDEPVNRIITIGVGVTATAIGVGALDKIAVCDSYSRTNSDEIFDGLRERVDGGLVVAGGNIYSSGKEQLKVDIINAADPVTGTFDREKDVVFAVVSPSYRANLSFLEENGFRNVMYWDTVTSYGDIIDFVETISLVCNGKIDFHAATMRAVSDTIAVTLEQAGMTEKAGAFYVTYSSGSFKVGNTGSVSTAMIQAAGGDVLTIDDSKAMSTYERSLTLLVQDNPSAVIFADNTLASNQEYMGALRTMVGDDVKIVLLEQIWNNYSIKSADGVWTMACAMYPDLFSGDVPEPPVTGDDILTYFLSSMAIVAAILVMSFFYLRR